MMKHKIIGNDLYCKVAKVSGSKIYDADNREIGSFTKNEIFDGRKKKLAMLNGSDVIDEKSRKIASVSQISSFIDGHARPEIMVAMWLTAIKNK
ncbi:MAG: hypothetical protein PHX16_09270 [Syntrophaceticus sp.]|nr:hypothetical protein [Syntrophaceticus sp.]